MNEYMYGFYSFYFYFFIFYFVYATIIYSKIVVYNRINLYNIVLFLPLFILGAFRAETVGGDLNNYIPAFIDICNEESVADVLASGYEPGYSLMNKFIGYVSSNPRFLLVCTSFLSLIGPCYMITKYSNNILVSVIMFCMMGFYTTTFNLVRQSIAVSIFFLSIPYLINRNRIKYILCSILAISMHYSAIVLLLAYPLTNKELTKERFLLYLTIVVALYIIVGTSILTTIITIFFPKYNAESIMMDNSGSGWNLLILYLFIFLFLFLIYIKKKDTLSLSDRGLTNTLIVFLMFALFFQLFATAYSFVTRMGLYFFIPIIITLPRFYSLVSHTIIKIYLMVLTIFLCVFFFYKAYSYNEETGANDQSTLPYVFIEE